MGADIVGHSVLMARAEADTCRRGGAELDRVFREIEKRHGREGIADPGRIARPSSAPG